MTCERRLVFGPRPGWSNGSTSTGGAGPDILLTPWINTRDIVKVRIAQKFTESSGALKIASMYEMSADRVTVQQSGTVHSAYFSTEDSWDLSDWVSLNTAGRLWVRFGIRCRNTTGSEIEKGRLHMIVDIDRRA